MIIIKRNVSIFPFSFIVKRIVFSLTVEICVNLAAEDLLWRTLVILKLASFFILLVFFVFLVKNIQPWYCWTLFEISYPVNKYFRCSRFLNRPNLYIPSISCSGHLFIKIHMKSKLLWKYTSSWWVLLFVKSGETSTVFSKLKFASSNISCYQ